MANPEPAPQAPAALHADEDESLETDSSLGEDVESYTSSLKSSLLESIEENGRGYHKYKQGKYVVPNDEDEMNRLDLQHHLYLLTTKGRLHLAPIPESVGTVLDVGTGTGVWAIEFADQYPDTQVIGVDLSAMQPSLVPTNLKFEIDDVEEQWTYPHKFDYIHSRGMLGALKDWPAFIKQCFDALEPGAYLELQEASLPAKADDGSYPDTCEYHRWNELMLSAADKISRSLSTAPNIKQFMIDAGFTNVNETVYKWPTNKWPKDPDMKELGTWQLVNLMEGLHGFSVALFTRVLGMSVSELEVMLASVRNEIRDPKYHTYWPVFYVYGQKPEN